ncbi:hypothetical protein HHK36_028248 [Tetracentron sinense]|uniref:Uncharacterized protein n=1 Tax=Tetracentron sinense TaxID=13715 RepID=A0A835D559_TETSI|nr:hypothetical protein HHK36_028248 [Tetracentron sinense]
MKSEAKKKKRYSRKLYAWLPYDNRTANCNGMGSACGDLRFIGGEGNLFYFRRPEGRMRDNTQIQALGLMFESHTFTLFANKVSQWNDNVDQLLFTYDNMPVFVNEGHTFTLASSDSDLVEEWTAKCNSITVTFPGVSISGSSISRRGLKECWARHLVQSSRAHPVKRDVAIMGGEDKYMTSSLFSADSLLHFLARDFISGQAFGVGSQQRHRMQ